MNGAQLVMIYGDSSELMIGPPAVSKQGIGKREQKPPRRN
jgi:hypothetical protein